MATLTNITKSSATLLANIIKSSEGIFWIAENGDTYLVGSGETLNFITQEVGGLSNIIKN